MTAETLRVVIATVLLLHGVAHLVALGALVAILVGVHTPTGPVLRLWALPMLSTRTAALAGALLWAAAATGFLGGAGAIWGLWLDALAWRPLSSGAAMISLLGMAVFVGTWPGSPSRNRSALNSAIAVLVDGIILAAVVCLRWPPLELLGR
ncbi:MAG: hypothetical protein FJZ97_08870 [Chloroflexi bacterium]|nr:hypothetical protein [Chloroflexota bacterium]